MHEMSLIKGMLQIIEDQAELQGFSKVKTVWLELGKLSHAEPESIRFCFDIAVQNTLAAGATLEIIRTPAFAWCMDCAQKVSIKQRYDSCHLCGSFKLSPIEGDKMQIKQLEVI